MMNNVEESLFIGLRERDMNTEALRQRYKLLHRIITMNIVALTVGEGFLYDVPPIAGSIDDRVTCLS